jgi:hypothetical protein
MSAEVMKHEETAIEPRPTSMLETVMLAIAKPGMTPEVPRLARRRGEAVGANREADR